MSTVIGKNHQQSNYPKHFVADKNKVENKASIPDILNISFLLDLI